MAYNLINTLLSKPTPYTPIWLMRQAGRYLPEYRKIRETAKSFMGLCTNPELATIVTLQPLERFNLDAAILFSDILVIPDAMGLGLKFVENEGPKFSKPILKESDIDNLAKEFSLEKLNYVFTTIKNVSHKLNGNKPLIGFSGSPFTIACYMLEGGSSKDYLIVKKWLYQNPTYMHKLLDLLSDAIILYLNEQIRSGVDAVMLFDSWGGILTDVAYAEFSLSYVKKIINALIKEHNGKQIPNIVFTKGGGLWLEKISKVSPNAIGVDWTIDIGIARENVPSHIAIQGNLDPVLLSVADKETIKREIKRIVDSYKKAHNGSLTGLVFNLGHGILPSANLDNVNYLVESVHEFTQR